MRPSNGAPLKDGGNESAMPTLSYSYVYKFTPLMEQRLSQAGVSLAAYLDGLFAEVTARQKRGAR